MRLLYLITLLFNLVSFICAAQLNVTVADYLTSRLVDIGAPPVFGVTGDYSYPFLHSVEARPELVRIGNNNEQEAGYAAWGYARASKKNVPGVVTVTYGAGALPVLNAIAGADRENLAIIVVAGAAPTASYEEYDAFGGGTLQHHMSEGLINLQAGVFSHYTYAQSLINNAATAGAQIDYAITQALIYKRPVYIEVWEDIWTQVIPAPHGHIHPKQLPYPSSVQSNVDSAVALTLAKLQASHFPLIWIGRQIKDYELQDLFTTFVNLTKIPFITNGPAKGIITEANPYWAGVIRGSGPGATNLTKTTDFLLELGTIYTDSSVDGAIGTWAPNANYFIRVQRNFVTSSTRQFFASVPLPLFLEGLLAAVTSAHYVNAAFSPSLHVVYPPPTTPIFTANITYTSFVNHFIYANLNNENTSVIIDTSQVKGHMFGAIFANENGYFADDLWETIGWTGGASIGIKLALNHTRPIVVVGDGGFQNLPTALATAAALQQDTIVFLLHNNIYAIEQGIENRAALTNPAIPIYPENIIQDWDYVKLAQAVGAKGWSASTHGELVTAIASAVAHKGGTSLVEVIMPRLGS